MSWLGAAYVAGHQPAAHPRHPAVDRRAELSPMKRDAPSLSSVRAARSSMSVCALPSPPLIALQHGFFFAREPDE